MSDPSSRPPPSNDSSALHRVGTFIRILNVRLRFIFLMVLVGLVAGNWESLMNRWDRWRRPARAPETVMASDVEYFCPMHPNIVRAEPGNCPICGMPLSKRARSSGTAPAAGALARVQMSPQKMEMGRIATSPVEYRLLAREIRTVGIVEYDETKRAFVAVRVKARIDELMVNYVGQQIEKGAPLASIYSPDLLVAQEELLTAVRQSQEPRGDKGPGNVAQSLLDASRRKLVLWGVTEEEINEIIRRGTAQTHLTLHSPISGIVTEKNVLPGRYVAEGDNLYTIADLSRVWMQAKIFEDQMAGVQIGTAVEVTSVASPNEIFAGHITFLAYNIDPATRTVAARVEIANPDLKLRPGMYANATIRLPVGTVTVLKEHPTTNAVASAARTDGLAEAYVSLVVDLARDKTGADMAARLAHEAHGLVKDSNEDLKSRAKQIADLSGQFAGKDLESQRELLKKLSGQVIALLRAAPPSKLLSVAHCPMVNADWLQTTNEIANPYFGSKMLKCGSITGRIEPSASDGPASRYAEGYFCPVYPDHLFDEPRECPIDKFPLHYARVEKALAIPDSAVINTGNRKIVYLQSGPTSFDMVQVELGPRAGGYFPVLSGLRPGERVATSGAFLVDAENRLNPAAGAQYFGASGGAPAGGHQHGG